MHVKRNRALLLSVGTGVLTKFAGAAMTIVALPVIARTLSLQDYATFIAAMTCASASALLFGAASILGTAQIAAVPSMSEKATAAADAASFLAFIGLLVFAVAVLLVMIFDRTTIGAMILLSIGLATAQGMFLGGDIWRLATGSSHLSNLYQLGGGVVTVGLIVIARSESLILTLIFYFGIPALTQLAITASTPVRFSLSGKSLAVNIRKIRQLGPILFNSLADYLKIFGSSAVVGWSSDSMTYAVHTTLLLLAARLVNPVALLARPLLPAYVDACTAKDNAWLKTARKLLIGLATTASIAGLCFGLIVDLQWLAYVLPPDAPVTRSQINLLIIFVLAHGLGAVLSPLFLVSPWRNVFANVYLGSVAFIIGSGWYLSTVLKLSDGMLVSVAIGSAAVTLTFLIGASGLLFSPEVKPFSRVGNE